MGTAKVWKLGKKWAGISAQGKRVVKDTKEAARLAVGLTSKSKSTTKKSNPKKGGKRVGKNTTQTIWKLARVIAGVGPFLEPALHTEWPTNVKVGVAGARLTGYRFDVGKWELSRLVEGYGPLLATVVAQKASSFVRGLIRRL